MPSNRKDSDQLDLLSWKPPRQVIPFPSRLRSGHARKVAAQLAAARTKREADFILIRAMEAHERQMARSGVEQEDLRQQLGEWKATIYNECLNLKSKWVPAFQGEARNPEGAA